MTKIKKCSIEQIPMGPNVYRKLATTSHNFEPAMFYSFRVGFCGVPAGGAFFRLYLLAILVLMLSHLLFLVIL